MSTEGSKEDLLRQRRRRRCCRCFSSPQLMSPHTSTVGLGCDAACARGIECLKGSLERKEEAGRARRRLLEKGGRAERGRGRRDGGGGEGLLTTRGAALGVVEDRESSRESLEAKRKQSIPATFAVASFPLLVRHSLFSARSALRNQHLASSLASTQLARCTLALSTEEQEARG